MLILSPANLIVTVGLKQRGLTYIFYVHYRGYYIGLKLIKELK